MSEYRERLIIVHVEDGAFYIVADLLVSYWIWLFPRLKILTFHPQYASMHRYVHSQTKTSVDTAHHKSFVLDKAFNFPR